MYVKYLCIGKIMYAKLHLTFLPNHGTYVEGWAVSNGKVWYNSPRRLRIDEIVRVEESEAMAAT